MKSMIFALLFLLSPALLAGADPVARPRWSIVVYAGTDEEDLDEYTAPVIEKMIDGTFKLPADTQLILENDADGLEGVTRVVRGAGQPFKRVDLPEHDSADPRVFGDFLTWAKSEIRGENVLFVMITHSWGWKGLVQDFAIPGKPDDDTMMPLHVVTKTMKDADFRPEVFFLDSCVLGNVEPIDEFEGTTDYLTVSQRETPYSGFPVQNLFDVMEKARQAGSPLAPVELARLLPSIYAGAFARGGSSAADENGYFATSAVTLNMRNWPSFREEFKALIASLRAAGFTEFLRKNPKWPSRITDMDKNADLVELLLRLEGESADPEVRRIAAGLLVQIGYPRSPPHSPGRLIEVSARETARIEVSIQADELLKEGTEDDPKMSVLDQLKASWKTVNRDLNLPSNLAFRLIERDQGTWRFLIVGGSVKSDFAFRPWLEGTQAVSIRRCDRGGRCSTEAIATRDLVDVRDFPSTSIYLSEAHTSGAPFVHGIGVALHPFMDHREERAVDPTSGLKGPAYYRSLKWNRTTGWADLVQLDPVASKTPPRRWKDEAIPRRFRKK